MNEAPNLVIGNIRHCVRILRNTKVPQAKAHPFYKNGSCCGMGAVLLGLGHEPKFYFDDNNYTSETKDGDAYQLLNHFVGVKVTVKIFQMNDFGDTFEQIANTLEKEYQNHEGY